MAASPASPHAPPVPGSQPIYVYNAGPLALNIWVNANPSLGQPATMTNLTPTDAQQQFAPVEATNSLWFVPVSTPPAAGQLCFGANTLYFQFESNPISPAVTVTIPLGTQPEPSALYVFYQSGNTSATTYIYTWQGVPLAGSVVL